MNVRLDNTMSNLRNMSIFGKDISFKRLRIGELTKKGALGKARYIILSIKRLFDVFFMMLFFHVWPEQTYRFSTRKCLPHKGIRFEKREVVLLPFDLNKEKINYTSKLDEIDIVMKGSSFDLNRIENMNTSIFLSGFYASTKFEKDVTYVTCDARYAKKFLEAGLQVIYVEVCGIDDKGNIFSYDRHSQESWYNDLFNDSHCKCISIVEKVYRRNI